MKLILLAVLTVLSVGTMCSMSYADECETPFIGTIYPSTLYSMDEFTTVGEFPTQKDCEGSMLNLLHMMEIPLERAPMYQCSWGCRHLNQDAEEMPYYDRLRVCRGIYDYRAPFHTTSLPAVRGEVASCKNIKNYEKDKLKPVEK